MSYRMVREALARMGTDSLCGTGVWRAVSGKLRQRSLALHLRSYFPIDYGFRSSRSTMPDLP